jgi:polyisoprenoid-binding protein YceI
MPTRSRVPRALRLIGCGLIGALYAAGPVPQPRVLPLDKVARSTEGKSLSQMPAGAYRTDNDHTHIYFTISHVGFSSTHGRFDKFDGTLDFRPQDPGGSPLAVTIDARSVDMNQHELEAVLRSDRFFASDRYPEIRFVSRALAITGPREGVLHGNLTMRGLTRPVELKVRLNRFLVDDELKWTRFGFSASGTLKRSDWGMTAVPLVGDEVTLSIDVEFLKVV